MTHADDDRAMSKVTLPKNLPEMLKRLDDLELGALLDDVTAEAERRGARLPNSRRSSKAAKPQLSPAKRGSTRDPPDALPTGKANLIRASQQAGMKPAAIARSFRLSQSVVNRILNQPAKAAK
jgi:hypothetical protein